MRYILKSIKNVRHVDSRQNNVSKNHLGLKRKIFINRGQFLVLSVIPHKQYKKYDNSISVKRAVRSLL